MAGKYEKSLKKDLNQAVDIYLKFHHSIPVAVLTKLCEKYGVTPESFAPMMVVTVDKPIEEIL